MEKTKLIINIFISLAIVYLATSIIIFSSSVNNLNENLPEVLESIENIESKLDMNATLKTANNAIDVIPHILNETKSVREEIAQIRQMLPSIMTQVDNTNKNIPILLQEFEEVRKIVPSVLNESESIRKNIPYILKESKNIRADLPMVLNESKEIRKTIPSLLQESHNIRLTIPTVLDESKNIRASIPPILAESQDLRNKLPQEIDKVSSIVQSVEKISTSGISGTIGKTFDGVISIPKKVLNRTKQVEDNLEKETINNDNHNIDFFNSSEDEY